MTVNELQPSWIEVRDSTNRCERGSFDFAVSHVRKWVTGALVAAHTDLLWLHAAAATLDETALLLVGPAGAGKSTLIVKLLERGWGLLADDAVGLLAPQHKALPLAFHPEVRTARRLEDDWRSFLEQPKRLAHVPPAQVASTPALCGAVVFPEFSSDVDGCVLTPLTAVMAAQRMASQCLQPGDDRRPALERMFRLAGDVPCYRLLYGQPEGAAAELTERWPSLRRR